MIIPVKKGRSVLCQRHLVEYAIIKEHKREFPVRPMCRILKVHPSGFSKWLKEPESPRTFENKKIIEMIRFFWKERGQVYGSPNIHEDFKDAGYSYSVNRIARLMKVNGIKGAHRRKRHHVPWAPGYVYQANFLNRGFSVSSPNQAWCTDITYIKTYEGFLYIWQ